MSTPTPQWIRVLGEEDLRAELPLKEMLVVGSSPERAGLVVTGQGVDSTHCAIGKVKGGGWAIKDLGSRYGTIVNGRKITSARLALGDLVVLGSRRLRVEDDTSPAAPAASPLAAPAAVSPPAAPAAAAPAAKPAGVRSAAPLEEILEPVAVDEERRRLGGYRLDKLLGRGGMGAVYLALQESLNRPVALKILSPRLAADADFVRRFQEEARAAAALNHPNVVVVHDVGEGDGRHFLSMEFMPGGTLEHHVTERGSLPWREVLDVLADASAGLMYAEAQGIVHRDIKPANLMRIGTGTVKIADLGLATKMEAEATQSEGRKIFGTPHFISPEQARGEAVDSRSDLYSLGATAYRLLTGHTPFEGETTRDILRGHFTVEPAPLATHEPAIPPELNALVQRLLRKDPGARFQSASELRDEVERLRRWADGADGLTVIAPPSKSGVPLLVAVGVVITASIGGWFFLAGGNGEEADPDEEVVVTAPDPDVEDPEFFEGDGGPSILGEEEERRLQILDLQAQIDYRDIPASFSGEQRLEKLRELATTYAGTETALAMRTEIRELEGHLASTAAEQTRLQRSLTDAEAELVAAAKWPPAEGSGLPDPADALRQVERYEAPPELIDHPVWLARREALIRDIATRSHAAFLPRLDEARTKLQGGDFEGARQLLADLDRRIDLPSPAPADELEEVATLRRFADQLRALRDGLPAAERAWRAARRDEDRAHLASGLGWSSGLEEELRTLQLETVTTRLATLEQQLGSETLRTHVREIAAQAAIARAALDSLAAAFADQGWRRRTIVDPRGRREAVRDAVGASGEGVLVRVDGENELIPWSTYGGRVELIEQVFKGRLERDYSADEHRGILVLLRLAAVSEAIDLADQVLRPDGRSIFQPAEAEQMLEAFDRALRWAEGFSGAQRGEMKTQLDALTAERDAARLLGAALLAAEEEAWASVVGEMENLFVDHQDTLLVTLLSDGSGWREAPAPAPSPPGAGSDGAPPADGR